MVDVGINQIKEDSLVRFFYLVERALAVGIYLVERVLYTIGIYLVSVRELYYIKK